MPKASEELTNARKEEIIRACAFLCQPPLYEIMDGLNNMVKAGKARYIGISNCFAWQLAKANALAEKEGFAKFISIRNYSVRSWL